MTEREKVKDMVRGLYFSGSGCVDTITDYILADRRRICHFVLMKKNGGLVLTGIEQKTLKLAGLDKQ